ncbi:MAG: acyl-CoA dehydrogenase family protein, partial [Acidimicrobiales bacterium]
MPIALTDDHRSLAETVGDFLRKHDSRAAARALLESAEEPLPSFWKELTSLGWLGLHIDEEYGGSGYGLPELVVVVEETGRGIAPGPFVPTVTASAIIAATGDDATRKQLLPGLADGSTFGAVALGGSVESRDGALT